MRPHLHLLGVLQLLWGAIGLLLGTSTLLLAIAAIAIGVSSAEVRIASGITAAVFAVSAVGLLAGGGANAWGGAALRRQQASGRTAVLWLAVVNLFVLPVGTALGIYAFWVLLHHDTRSVFVGPAASARGIDR